jgi:hypothetical protein
MTTIKDSDSTYYMNKSTGSIDTGENWLSDQREIGFPDSDFDDLYDMKLSLDIPSFRSGKLLVCVDGCPTCDFDHNSYPALIDHDLWVEYDLISTLIGNLQEGIWPVVST